MLKVGEANFPSNFAFAQLPVKS
ncbi:hypothetical protein ALC60_01800 [Trachymyrmex zeteki]|uniref:Uncharacterized protein n=1 Tax=Mycetomoellerius zeteki TaxID=64791 RepID=A0A151XFP6_9HYME|nr:hypothetical protein ALC60_01800 [Trachymyrmex zeteki]